MSRAKNEASNSKPLFLTQLSLSPHLPLLNKVIDMKQIMKLVKKHKIDLK